MADKGGGFLKYIAILVVVIIVIAGFYIFKPEEPIVLAEEGDVSILLELDEEIYYNDSFTGYTNITITNVAEHYIHVWADPNHYKFHLINNSITYFQSKPLISAICDYIKLEPGDNIILTQQSIRDSYRARYTITLPTPGNYQIYFYMFDFNTTSNTVSFEIRE